VQTCGKCNTQSSDLVQACPKCGSDLRAHSKTALARAEMQRSGRVSLIRVAVAHNCCPACAAAQGAHPKDDAPVLPIEGCSHGLGCRCFYEPVLTEIYP
jgi:predicted  nucleic acid-binding Zn-ribbon protein